MTFDTLVDQLVGRGFARATAEAEIRRQRPELAPDPAEVQRDAAVREKAEQAAVTKLFREHGFTVRSTSQARPSKIALGFPDLFVTHKRLAIGFFFETKRRVGGVVSDAQQDFANDCARCGISWYTGDRHRAAALMRQLKVPPIP